MFFQVIIFFILIIETSFCIYSNSSTKSHNLTIDGCVALKDFFFLIKKCPVVYVKRSTFSNDECTVIIAKC